MGNQILHPDPSSLPSHTIQINPPLTAITPTDQTGTIAILTAFSLGLALLSAGIRISTRRTAHTPRSDCAFYSAVCLGVVELATTLYLVSEGLGRDAGAGRVKAGVVATGVLYLAALGASKVCCAVMFVWITPFEGQRRAAWGLVGGAVGWVVSGVFMEGFGCRDVAGRCAGYRGRWVYISVGDMVIEGALIGMSVCMVWSRSMSSRAKYAVVGAFSCRFPNIAITLTRLVFLTTDGPTEAIQVSRLQATAQLGIGYTIVSCVVPYLRPLMQSYESDDAGHGRADASFKLSDQSRGSRGSKGSGFGDLDTGKGKARAVGVELNDVSQLLAPKLARLRPAEVERADRQV